jgi:hypothetical protein
MHRLPRSVRTSSAEFPQDAFDLHIWKSANWLQTNSKTFDPK